MRNRFDRQLKNLNDGLIEMGSMIEKSIEKALVALVTQNVEKAKEVIAFDLEIDRQEREIESLCMKLLLQQQPVARAGKTWITRNIFDEQFFILIDQMTTN